MAQVQYNLKKYLTVTTLGVVLAIVTTFGLYTIFNTRAKLKLVEAELTSKTAMYDIVAKEKARLDSLATFYMQSIALRDTAIARKDRQVAELDKENLSLRHNLASALIDVKKLRADSSYAYINRRIPPTSELKYPFDSTQVKQIHYTFVERDGCFEINDNLTRLVDTLKIASFVKSNQIDDLKSLNDVYLRQNEMCKQENGAYKDEVKALNKDNKHQRIFKNISNGTVIGLLVVLLITAL